MKMEIGKKFLFFVCLILLFSFVNAQPSLNYEGTLLAANDFGNISSHTTGTNYAWKSVRVQGLTSGTATHFLVYMKAKDYWIGDQSSKDVGFAVYADAGEGVNPGTLLSKGYVQNYDFDSDGDFIGSSNDFYLDFQLDTPITISSGAWYHLTMLIEDTDGNGDLDAIFYGRDNDCSPCPDKWQSSGPSDDFPSNPPDDGVEPDWSFQYATTSAAYSWGLVELTSSAPPVRSNGAPTGILPSGTTQATLSLTTDEDATCRHSTTAGTSYSSMTDTFSGGGTTSHSTTVPVSDGNSYTYYVRCIDSSLNENTDDYPISFSVAIASSCGTADNNPIDGVVSTSELSSYISLWKSGTITISELLSGIDEWKNGC